MGRNVFCKRFEIEHGRQAGRAFADRGRRRRYPAVVTQIERRRQIAHADLNLLRVIRILISPTWRFTLRGHAAMEAASLLREALWSLVSVSHLDRPGVDYAAYAHENFQKLDASLAAFRSRFGKPVA